MFRTWMRPLCPCRPRSLPGVPNETLRVNRVSYVRLHDCVSFTSGMHMQQQHRKRPLIFPIPPVRRNP